MDICRLDEAEFSRAYGILCASLSSSFGHDALYPTFCKVPVGGKTAGHSHFEPELFYVIGGEGRMDIDGEVAFVKNGDLIRIPPNSRHELENSGPEDLAFLSVYSEDIAIPPVPSAALVTAAPPTPNGSLHLGHISGPYLAADIMARHLRSRGCEVKTHSGTDDHQNYVGERAHAMGLEPEDFRKKMRSRIETSLRTMGIGFDEFIEPKSDGQYQTRVLKFAQAAIAKGIIVKETVDFPHCPHCDHALVDALIAGICPVCEQGSSGGCENCGILVPPQDLHHAKCSRCGRAAEYKPLSVYTFDLKRHLPAVELGKLNLTPRLRELVARVEGAKAMKVLVSHPGGLRLPDSDQGLHVWFEMAAHYEKFALSDRMWIHAFGFDNSFYYLLFIPALLKAMNPRAKVPDAILTNEFLLLDGLKFSTSRGHALWADEFAGNADHLRLYLSLQRPHVRQTDFSLSAFQAFSAHLDSQLRELHELARAEVKPGTAHADCTRFTRDIEAFLSPETFDTRRAARRILEFLDATLHDGDRLMIQTLAAAMTAIMPETAQSLREALG